MTVGERGEHALIEWLRRHVPGPGPDVIVGIGDDAAVVRPPRGTLLVQTTDALVDGVHVDARLLSPGDIGRRAVAVNLSDLAAMGARPMWLLLSLVLPASLPLSAFEALVEGVRDEATRWGAAVIGGNITQTPGPLVIDVTATGAVRPRRLLRRDTARPGDELWITGTLGGAAAGLGLLRAGAAGSEAERDAVACYATPTPRLREAWALARERAARAAIDVSDGLADAIHQLAIASGTGARVDAAAVPIHPAATAWSRTAGRDALDVAMASDDYELLVAVPPKARGRLAAARRGCRTPIPRIGVLTAGRDVVVERGGVEMPVPAGFEHFATS
ncbi:MAG: thiamine-phosphate kinase [Vicinamibacterales bacterium]